MSLRNKNLLLIRQKLGLNVIVSPLLCTFAADAYHGTHLNFSRVVRRQMGAYLCIASNDVPPAVSKRVFLNVHCK